MYTNNITVHFSNFYRTWHTDVNNAFIYMMVGALDLETRSTKNYTAQIPGPWDRDSNSGWRYILCNVCYSKILNVAYTLQIYYEI